MIQSPVTIQLSPGAEATIARLKDNARRKTGTLRVKLVAAKSAFRETQLALPVVEVEPEPPFAPVFSFIHGIDG